MKILSKILSINRKHVACIQFTNSYCTSGRNIRVRFAPSPTGYLHLGGLRTALYNYLFAKAHNGTFILRIEDTDQTRMIKGAAEQLEVDLKWAGIEINEGSTQGGAYGPYVQSQRLDKYKEYVDILLKNGSAYHCFCTERRLNLLKREAIKLQEIPKYDNRCRSLSQFEVQERLRQGQQSCVRFKLSDQEETFDDLVYGKISYNIALNEGDPVIIKSDGYPTYHFANVVDDYMMNISHVLRGVEWQISTTKHILLYRAFNWQPPQYGHLPLLMNADGTKLSKRQNDIKISHYRENKILPLALINFIVQSGGGFTKDLMKNVRPQCFTIDELCQQFDVSQINPHSGKLMNERLLQFNRLAIKKNLSNDVLVHNMVEEVKELLKKTYPENVLNHTLQLDDDYITNILHWAANRICTLSDLVTSDFEFIWIVPNNYTDIDNSQTDLIQNLKTNILTMETIKKDDMNVFFKEFSKSNGLKYGKFMKTMRAILSGLKEGPSVAEMIEILGKKNTIDRLDYYINNAKH